MEVLDNFRVLYGFSQRVEKISKKKKIRYKELLRVRWVRGIYSLSSTVKYGIWGTGEKKRKKYLVKDGSS